MGDVRSHLAKLLAGNPIFRRLLHGAGANFIGKIWVLIIQLISVPVMSASWGVEGFGVWLMISAIPTYLALSDFGLGVAAGVDLTGAMERGDHEAGLRVFQSVWSFLTVMTLSVGIFCIAGAGLWLFLSDSKSAGPFSPTEIFWSVTLIVIAALATMQMSIRKIVFQATHKYALGTAAFDLIYFVGLLLVLVSVLAGGGLWVAAMVQLLSRVAGLMAFSRLQKHYEPWCSVGMKYADKTTLKYLMNPSLSALTLTLANSFGLQGVVLTIGWAISPTAAAIFATTRMLTRIPMQFSGLVTRASLPELTRAQVAGNTELTRRLMKLNMRLTLAVIVPAMVVLIAYGPSIITYISHNEMSQSRIAFALLGLAAVFCAVWTTLGTRLIAVNRQSEFAYLALALYLASALVPFITNGNMLPILIILAVADGAIAIKTWKVR